MARELHLDFETRSEADLKKLGSHAYFEHPSTSVICAAYAFDDEEPNIWFLDDYTMPRRMRAHIDNGEVVTAWNAAFERLAWRHIMNPKHGWCEIDDSQWQCTMTEALALNMPGQLEKAGPAFGLNSVKDDAGYKLMMKMCKPRKARKGEDPNGVYWHFDAAMIERLGEYCKQDVRVEAEIGKRILRMRPSERQLYMLDMKINDRGVLIDKKLCESAEIVVDSAMDRLDSEMRRVTANQVSACTSTIQLCKWLQLRGVPTDSVDREHIEDLLILDLPDDCRRALELRQEGSKTSTAKIGAMLRRQQKDGRMRGNLQFYGASATGRWAARGAQLQNLTRPQILGSKALKKTPLDYQIDQAITAIHNRSSVAIELIYGQPLTLVADCVRSMICAPSGYVLRSSDFSNIEGRVVAWLAGQEDKLEAFRAFDAKTGPDLYLIQAAAIYNCSLLEAEQHRQIGKVGELSLGYQGGPRAFAKMAKNYGVRIAQQYEGIWSTAAEEFKEKAVAAWDERGRKTGMEMEAWLAAEVIKLAWRAKNWRIEALWKEIEEAAIEAVQKKGDIITCGKVKFRSAGSFLFCLLPSGRALSYPYPFLKETETPWGTMKQQLRFKSADPVTKQWGERVAYGGHLVENITQAVARDVMAEAMLRIDAAGHQLVLTVHDEIIAEDPINFSSMDEFNDLMTELPVWATGLPISVGGWEGQRYRKA